MAYDPDDDFDDLPDEEDDLLWNPDKMRRQSRDWVTEDDEWNGNWDD